MKNDKNEPSIWVLLFANKKGPPVWVLLLAVVLIGGLGWWLAHWKAGLVAAGMVAAVFLLCCLTGWEDGTGPTGGSSDLRRIPGEDRNSGSRLRDSQAFTDGYDARMAGTLKGACPAALLGAERHSWHAGWNAADYQST